MSDDKNFEICWDKNRDGEYKLTAESFVRLWQSSADAYALEDRMDETARPHLIKRLELEVRRFANQERFIEDVRRDIVPDDSGTGFGFFASVAANILNGTKVYVYRSTWGPCGRNAISFDRLNGEEHAAFCAEFGGKPDWCEAFNVSKETYLNALQAQLDDDKKDIDRTKEEIEGKRKSCYSPNWWGLYLRACIFRKKGVNLKRLKRLAYDEPKGGTGADWGHLAEVAAAA